MRADRVAQTFSSASLNAAAISRDEGAATTTGARKEKVGSRKHTPLLNLAVVGDECGNFLKRRVEDGIVQHIFVRCSVL
jgi:hypothetical protein